MTKFSIIEIAFGEVQDLIGPFDDRDKAVDHAMTLRKYAKENNLPWFYIVRSMKPE